MATIYDPETGEISEEEDTIEVDLEDLAAQSKAPDYFGAAMEGVADIWRGPAQLGQSAAEAVQEHPYLSSIPGVGPAMAMGYEGGKYLYKNPEAIAPSVGAAATLGLTAMSPIVGLPTAAPIQGVAQSLNEYLELTPPTSTADKQEQMVRNAVGVGAGYFGPKLASSAIRAGTGYLNKADRILRQNDNLWEGAQRPGSTANALDAGRGQPGRELQIVEDIKPYEAKFHEMAPYAGIDDVRGQSALQRMRDNLGSQKDQALSVKQQVLDLVDQRGPGISLEDIDLSQLDKYGPGTFTEGASHVKNKITSAFTSGPRSEWEKAMGVSTPKNLSANQVQQMVRELDREIAKLGGYDDLLNAQAPFDPSKIAPHVEHLGALRAARNELNDVLNRYSGRVLGIESPLTEVNARASTALEYEPLMRRYQNTIGQGITPGSARSMTGVQQRASTAWNGPVNFALDQATGGWLRGLSNEAGTAEALSADFQAVNKLQQYGKLRGTPYRPVRGPKVFTPMNAASEAFQGIMDAIAPILPALASIDPTTGQVHDPNERRMLISAIQNTNASPSVMGQAVSDLTGGKLPRGIQATEPQPVEMPDVSVAYDAANNAMGDEIDLESYAASETEDERVARMMDEVDYNRSGY